MSSLNLTEIEARERSQLIEAQHYHVALDVTGSERFSSRTTAIFTARAAGDTFIDLNTDDVSKVLLDGSELDLTNVSAENGIPLTVQPGDHVLQVEATIAYSHTGQGLHRFVDPADDQAYLYTQFETADAKRVFACFDQPDMKATYDLEVTANENDRVILNAPTTVEGATHRARIDYPLSTYLVAICVGPYAEFSDTWRGELTHHEQTPQDQPHELEIPMSIFCRASIAEHLDHERLFTETKQGFDFYHRNFGYAYPFGKYDQLFVPEFNMGAMENAGCVTLRDEYVFTSQATHYRYERRADTVLHEMAHMWFGDLVTMQWWGDLWLNESFATWAAAISQAEETQYDTAWVTFANVEKAWAYAQDQLPTTHPVSTSAEDIETVEQNFDGITYAKGASVLKQLQAYVGREEFFAGVRLHFARHAFGNATFDDLLSALEHTSGRDLSFWADQWLKTTGVNHVSFDRETSELVQSGDTLRTHRLAVGTYNVEGDKIVRTGRVELDISGQRTPVEGIDTQADLILPNDDDLTYALIDLDEKSLACALGNIEKMTDPMARTLLWSATWEMTRDGRLPARLFVELVARGAQTETELAVLERILSQATTAQRKYADPAWAQSSTVLVDALLAGARGSNPEAALVFEQALSKVELTDEAAEFFVSLLDDSDAERRWRATTALVGRGDRGEDLIAAQEESDRTASGRLHALQARAAVPSEANKARVWEELTSGSLGNLDARHLAQGFHFPGGEKSLHQFNEAYFGQVERIWNEFTSEMALQVAQALFPSWDISPEGVERGKSFAQREDIPAGLRRVIREGVDGVERALRNRGVDGASEVA
ncbi:aminopeptidase N [Corynebacterium tapiri]|uniref:Aminopeptidase N n=1 Tax=Corynebacterium tapiri TaxID=1448266 RepID=A0A5C4U1L4_9CORY|nr:aminopeptidase N [Corynebacterium tapiri]TNL94877.1 aminopeptidase N [Corynebacterium tapiri]